MRRYLPALLPLLLAAAAHADSIKFDGFDHNGDINGLRAGQLSMTVGGIDKLYDLAKVQFILISGDPSKLSDAEPIRETEPKAAYALYKDAIRQLNTPALKLLAQARAIQPADADGQWLDAVNLFLTVYQSQPTDAVWKLHPTHLPAATSSMLTDSASRIATVARNIQSEEASKNLKTMLLDIYTKAGKTADADRIAKELTGNAPDDAIAKPDNLTLSPAALAAIDASLKSKDAPAALKQIDALLTTATGDAAIQLFTLQSRAYDLQNKPDLATASLLRISAHYPSSPAVPAALLQAADLQKRANHPAAAKALAQELLEKFPDSKEAIQAKALL